MEKIEYMVSLKSKKNGRFLLMSFADFGCAWLLCGKSVNDERCDRGRNSSLYTGMHRRGFVLKSFGSLPLSPPPRGLVLRAFRSLTPSPPPRGFVLRAFRSLTPLPPPLCPPLWEQPPFSPTGASQNPTPPQSALCAQGGLENRGGSRGTAFGCSK